MARIKKISFNIARIIASIIFIVAWAKGEISGYHAWVLLFMLIDLKFEWSR